MNPDATSASRLSDTDLNRKGATPAELAAAVAVANVPVLLMILVQATGDMSWLSPRYTPSRTKGLTDHDSGGLPPEVQEEIREAALEVVLRLQAGEAPAIEIPSPTLMKEMMSVCMGEEVGDEYGEMLSEQLARFAGYKSAMSEPGAPRNTLRALVIGAGIAGTVAAQRLTEMGIDYEIIEKQPASGGNWLQNRYPGCGVDTPSHLYSLSFAKRDWTHHFEQRDEIVGYIEDVAKDIGAEQRTHYDTEVRRARYVEEDQQWLVEVDQPDGTHATLSADLLISAVGILNRPKVPDIRGRDQFEGTSMHTAEWNTDVSLDGLRVAVVGTGASAMQLVPAVADRVDQLYVFQRSPAWIAPFDKFREPIPEALRLLIAEVPLYHAWYWLRLFWQFGDKVIESLRVDPEWSHPQRSVNARNDAHRQFFTTYIRDQLGAEGADLLPKVLPDYPPFGKRILLDNGWYQALERDNVELIAEAVTEVCPSSIVSTSGREVAVDAIIWATGFHAAEFVSSLDIAGRDGHTLREAWDGDDARAHLGISVPGFPNLFLLGGPNSFPGSGSYMFISEMQMDYVARLIEAMVKKRAGTVEVKPSSFEAYNDAIDELHSRTVWSHPGMETYYRNSRGRVVFVSPFRNVDYWRMTREVTYEDYCFE